MKTIGILVIFILGVWISGCASLKPPVIIINGSIKNYKYIFISHTKSLTSGLGSIYSGNYGIYGGTMSKSINPSDVISGILLKDGFIILPELRPELVDQTLIVNYGESGRRDTGLGGYTIEVTIQFISSNSHTSICSCTAEGQGETEADDIRIAITRCLSGVLSGKK